MHTLELDVASPQLKKMVTMVMVHPEQLLVAVDTSHFVVAYGNSMSIWETVYGTCQGRLEPGYANITGVRWWAPTYHRGHTINNCGEGEGVTSVE